jgi:hypothetical protein
MTSKTTFEQIALSIPWIGSSTVRLNRIEALLQEAQASAGIQGSDLVHRLIRRFTFLSSDEYENMLLLIAQYIADNFDLATTILCATTADRHKDSAQKVLYDLTSTFALIGEYKVRAINRYDAIQREKTAFETVILIDEFIGSGQSIVGRVDAIVRSFLHAKKIPPLVHAIAIAGMSDSLRVIAHRFSSLNVCVALPKGIAHIAAATERLHEYRTMFTLEASLAPTSHGETLPSLGFAQCEALYSRQNGSCPNNVFPLFWWPELLGNVPRAPIFPRAL